MIADFGNTGGAGTAGGSGGGAGGTWANAALAQSTHSIETALVLAIIYSPECIDMKRRVAQAIARVTVTFINTPAYLRNMVFESDGSSGAAERNGGSAA
jgi:hypothetical protein